MGRAVRAALDRLASLDDVETFFITRTPENGTVTPADLRRLHLDAVWYPWNGMRFAPHAPSIVTIHDPFAFTYAHRNLVARWREQAPIRRALRKADCIFTVSQWGARELQRLFGISLDRVRVVPHAADPFWRPVETRAPAPYMLFLAGPDERKNAGMLFAAYDGAFADGGPQLIVAGSLGARDEARFTAMRAPRLRIASPSDDELRALYSGALAALVPSLAEGFGLPVIEAMACGTPVLASNATALPEAAGGAAMLLPPLDRHAWSDALQRIAHDAALRASLRERGFARVHAMDPGAPVSALLESVRRLREAAR
jgi:glycosyltransferase involved in cell wall biosynthesis